MRRVLPGGWEAGARRRSFSQNFRQMRAGIARQSRFRRRLSLTGVNVRAKAILWHSMRFRRRKQSQIFNYQKNHSSEFTAIFTDFHVFPGFHTEQFLMDIFTEVFRIFRNDRGRKAAESSVKFVLKHKNTRFQILKK